MSESAPRIPNNLTQKPGFWFIKIIFLLKLIANY